METVTVQTGTGSYPVFVGREALAQMKEVLSAESAVSRKILLISDKTVFRLYGERVTEQLQELGEVVVFTVDSGEQAKSFEQYHSIITFALEKGLNRKSMIAALGGGVIGDLAGFAAATYMRGIPFIQIPTTLLAHDSAVGGKTGINHPEGKNMIGAFHQPAAVFFNPQFLATLPKSELRSGMAEVIKHALIADASFLSWLEENPSAIESPTEDQLVKIITAGIRIKASVVADDEKETGIRAYLNFGHTLGHAIEAALGYGKMTHGDAVAAGMLFALWLSKKELGLGINYAKYTSWFQAIGFPSNIPGGLSSEQLLTLMAADKKADSGAIRMVLLNEIGSPVIKSFLPEKLKSLLEAFRKGEAA
ncbi:3-dehydroquinate synthase [Metabacillus sp. 113a]|uniref:3-dehydroquinate synthase n=1 Tax=Metabacillus sp. 113a TaxID=3404706 RepID=UPI003CF8F82B